AWRSRGRTRGDARGRGSPRSPGRGDFAEPYPGSLDAAWVRVLAFLVLRYSIHIVRRSLEKARKDCGPQRTRRGIGKEDRTHRCHQRARPRTRAALGSGAAPQKPVFSEEAGFLGAAAGRQAESRRWGAPERLAGTPRRPDEAGVAPELGV